MTVEIFAKGSNFKEFVTVHWNVVKISCDDGSFIITNNKGDVYLHPSDKYEMKIS